MANGKLPRPSLHTGRLSYRIGTCQNDCQTRSARYHNIMITGTISKRKMDLVRPKTPRFSGLLRSRLDHKNPYYNQKSPVSTWCRRAKQCTPYAVEKAIEVESLDNQGSELCFRELVPFDWVDSMWLEWDRSCNSLDK